MGNRIGYRRQNIHELHNFMLVAGYAADHIDAFLYKSHILLRVNYVIMINGVRQGSSEQYDFTEEQGLIEFFHFVGADIKSLTLCSHKSFCRINDILPMDSVTRISDLAPRDDPFVFQLKSMRSLFWLENFGKTGISVHPGAVFPSLAPYILETPPFKEWINKKREKIFNVVISTKKLGSFNVQFAKMLFEMI